VERPEIIPMEAANAYFPAKVRRSHRLFGVDRCLRVRRIEAEETAQ
jgi:hypothetical protein